MMLPPVGGSTTCHGGVQPHHQNHQPQQKQPQRQRADSLEQFFAERRQSHPALEPRPLRERRGTFSRERQQCHQRGEEQEEGEMASTANAILIRLPPLRATIGGDPELRSQLLLQKMRQCQQQVDWDGEENEPEGQKAEEKEVKADALRELTEWMGGEGAAKELQENAQMREELMEIVRTNLFRVLPPSDLANQETDPEELAGIGLASRLAASGACLEPGWAHLQLVYRLLEQMIQRVEPNKEGGLGEQFDGQMVSQILILFNSEDPRERDQLKQTLHTLYSRMIPLRSEIRKRIGWVLLSHVHEQQPCRGIPELLEILGDIVNGFNVPLKSEHRHYFLRILLPLHKPQGYLTYFAPLAFCTALFLEKDPTLAKPTFDALLRHWPKHSCAKEILFMAEMEELLAHIEQPEFQQICLPLTKQLAKCAASQHCRVAERALQMWNNENVLALMEPNCHLCLPIMFPALYLASDGHWSEQICTMVLKTLKRLMCLNAVMFEELVMNWEKEQLRKKKRRNESEELWRKLSDSLMGGEKGGKAEMMPSIVMVATEEKENSAGAAANANEKKRRGKSGERRRSRDGNGSSRRGSGDAGNGGGGRHRKGGGGHGHHHPQTTNPLIRQLAVI